MDDQLLKELMAVPEIAQELELTKESAYTKAELEAYDKYWDSISVEITLIADAENRGLLKGRQIGEEKGIQIGQENISKQTPINLKTQGKISLSKNADVTGLDEQVINEL